MDSLSKLTLQGYFEQLKSEVNDASGKKGHEKAGGYETLREESTFKLLELLIKATALVEEMHLSDPDFLHEDHVNDYQSMIESLNQHGIAYKGNQEILELDRKVPLPLAEKKPMQKAKTASKNSTNQKKKAG